MGRSDRIGPCLPTFTMVIFLLLLLTGTGCAGSIQGQVLDAQTGKPIAGAIVLGVWTKQEGMFGQYSTKLVGVREAETDAEGRFVLERVGGLFVEESVTVYKFGYIAWNNLYVFPGFDTRKETAVPAQIRLAPFPPRESRGEHMRFIGLATRSALSGRVSRPKFTDAIDRERRME